jgi:hypothetical protein
MNSRKNGPRLKKLKTLKMKRRVKKGGMFDPITFKFLKKSRPVSSKTKGKLTALSGHAGLLLKLLGTQSVRNPSSTPSRINAKQRRSDVIDTLLKDSKEFRERNDFEKAALQLRQAIVLGSLPARAELADFFRTGRTLKDHHVWDDYYGATYEYYDKAHALVYGQDDPDCKGVLALLYLDSAADPTVFYERPRDDPAFNPSDPDWHSPSHYALPLAQESADAGSKYGIYALGMWHLQDARKKADEANRMENHMLKNGLQKEDTTKEIMKMRSEVKASECEGVRRIGIAASPPYNYDQAQFMYARFYSSGVSNGFSCLMDMDKIKGSESEKEQQLRMLAIKYFKMAAAQGHPIAIKYVTDNEW